MKKPILFLLSFLAAVSLSACLIPEEEEFKTVPVIPEAEEVSYILANCTRRDIVNSDSVYVTYVSTKTTTLVFEENDLMYDAFFVTAGDAVQEGQLLAKLDTEAIDSEIARLESEIESTEAQLRRLEDEKEIREKRQDVMGTSMDYADYLKAKANLEKEIARTKLRYTDTLEIDAVKLEEAKKKLAKREIFAPFNGVITYIYAPNPDERSEAGKKMITIVDTENSMFRGDTDFYSVFSPGDTVTIQMNSGSSVEARFVLPETLDLSDTEKKYIHENTVCFQSTEPNFELASGEKGYFTLDFEHAENVLSVPAGAVGEILGEPVVYVPDEQGIMTYKPVVTGVTNGRFTEIKSGLQEDEAVIINRK